MCGRFTNMMTWRQLHELHRAVLEYKKDTGREPWSPKVNIAPTTQIPVLRYLDSQRRFDMMRWGLVPTWSKEIGTWATFNARSEELAGKPTYRGAWKAARRCVIPASSFFEWKKLDASAKPEKQPYAIALGNRGPMNFAGLWEVYAAEQ